jgi:hypothetical protein
MRRGLGHLVSLLNCSLDPSEIESIALDLMVLTARTGLQPRFLSYPIINHFINHLYYYGPCSFVDREARSIRHRIERAITPR